MDSPILQACATAVAAGFAALGAYFVQRNRGDVGRIHDQVKNVNGDTQTIRATLDGIADDLRLTRQELGRVSERLHDLERDMLMLRAAKTPV